MRLFLIFCLLFIFPAFSDKFEFCYFDMSGVPDSTFLKKNLRKDFGVKEDQTALHIHATKKGENINEAFKKWLDNMVTEDKNNCDGLVYSGYYTGGHYHQEDGDTKGDTNKLDLTFVEKLSCDPKYKSWFENVKQLWHFGSFSVTDTTVKKQSSKTGNLLATSVSQPDDDLSMRRLNLSFAHAMDRGSPLSSRWMRAFPNTHIYGWSDEAPTSHQIKADKNKDGWGGTHPVFEHIKQIGQAIEAQREETKNKEAIDKQTILTAAEALAQGDYCDNPWESIVTDGIGVEGVRQNKYGKTKELGCDLINAQQIMDLMKMDKHPKSLDTLTWCDNTFAKNEGKRKDCVNNPRKFIKSSVKEVCETLYSQEEKNECIKNPTAFSKNRILDTLKQINKTERELTEARKVLKDDKAGPGEKSQAGRTIRNIVGKAHVTDDSITVSHLLFNEIDSSYLTARQTLESEDSFFTDIRSVLSIDSPAIQALKEKTKSPSLSTTRKVDYIEFYKALHQNENNFVSESVQTIIDKELKCTYWKPTKKGACPKPIVGSSSSQIGKGRGADKITPQHHYTLTAVVSDQLKQYDLLTADQTGTLQQTLKAIPENESNDYIKKVTECLSAEGTDKFYDCKNQ